MTVWLYIIFILVLIWVLINTKKIIGHKKIIGKRVTVDYFDQNMAFETIFPANGTLTKTIKVDTTTFFLIKLDKTFTYDNNVFDTIAVRERAVGQALGYDRETDVHVLLPKTKLDKEKYSSSEFDHVVWATVELIK